MAYKGKFLGIKNPKKYQGNPDNIIYRSHWERNVMRWADECDKIIEWASEEIVIPYNHPLEDRRAKYYPDFWFKLEDGSQLIVEVKPAKETVKPPKPKRQTKRALQEMATWVINSEKWDTAVRLCEKNNIRFEIWTEDTLKAMGILNWETDKSVLAAESTKRAKPKMRPLNKKAPKRPRPKRKS